MSGSGKPKRRNHTVPKFYLQRFADGKGSLLRVELQCHVEKRDCAWRVTRLGLGWPPGYADGAWS